MNGKRVNSEQIIEGAYTAYVDASRQSNLAYRPSFVSNDRERGSKVLSTLELELSRCTKFAFSVAFIAESGIVPLKQTLKELEKKGIQGKILTTDYLTFSQPKALAWLNERSNIEVRMFSTGDVSGVKREGFHTKGYIFEYADGTYKALVGSSNLTGSALATNREWNTQIVSTINGELIRELTTEFRLLWNRSRSLDGVLETYERIYAEKQKILASQKVVSIEQIKLEPNEMQVEFVDSMNRLIAQGEKKALLISATGTGKTYASAFALRDENPNRVLFLAHREQILKQAKRSYERVFGDSKSFGLLSGNSHDVDVDYLFATMQTMAQDRVLHGFRHDEFDTIIIDEVHRAGANSYQKILSFFDAGLYLGMTASPDRPDGFDIYALFDNNIAGEIRLQKALENDLLCPFHYFGITDIAFEDLDEEVELADFNRLTEDRRVDYIIDQAKYYGFSGDRVKGLVFCSRREEAKSLSEAFNQRGFRTLSLDGDSSQQEREWASDRLAANPGDPHYDNRLDYIFTVDIFNEGVDIPEVNQVLMLRPTQSPIIFVQQLGRGLRKADGKEFVVIIDFIGNYANNYMIPLALSGDRSHNKDSVRKYVVEGNRTIPGCSSVHFDEISKQRVFDSIDRSQTPLRMLKEKYKVLKHKLGRIPSMVDFIDHGEIDPLLFIEKKGSYHAFLRYADKDYRIEFNADEELILEYLSRFIANGMRPHELLIIKNFLDGKTLDKDTFAEELYEYYYLQLSDDDYYSALRVIDGSFLNAPGDKRRYGEMDLAITNSRGFFSSSLLLQEALENSHFRSAVEDIVAFGLQRYKERYIGASDGLKLYQKYTRKDACRLLDWKQDDSSTVYGYRIKHGTCPIFVTYNKQKDISSSTQYEDKFVDQRVFSWMTRSRLTLKSNEVQKIIKAKETDLRVYLFIKKSDDEGSDFYYMGRVEPISYEQKTILDDNGDELPIVNFRLLLETPVRDDYYDYFVER